MSDAKLFAITYDIPSDKRRVRIANALKSFGERVQYSVFECFLAPKELLELEKRLRRLIDEAEDSIHIYPLRPPINILGLGEASQDAPLIMI